MRHLENIWETLGYMRGMLRERLFIPGYPISEKGGKGGGEDLSARSAHKITKSLREGGLGYRGGGGGVAAMPWFSTIAAER